MNTEQSRSTSLIFEGPLTVRNIDAAHGQLVAALRQNSLVTVDCSAATEVDLSLIQLLLAARLSAELAGKSVRLAGPAQSELREALLAGGFLPDAPEAAFWNADAPL